MRLSLLLLLAVACGGPQFVTPTGGDIYTIVNLRADRRGIISSVNYQENALVPLCTRVRIDRVRSREIRFTALDSGARYRFIRHGTSRVPIETHAQRIFGASCPAVTHASGEDQAGVQAGQVYQNMSREGVLLALGYPPEHRTPSLNNDVWHYWLSRRHEVEIFFVNNQVAGIRDPRAERVAARQARRAERRQARSSNVAVAASGGGVGVGVSGRGGSVGVASSGGSVGVGVAGNGGSSVGVAAGPGGVGVGVAGAGGGGVGVAVGGGGVAVGVSGGSPAPSPAGPNCEAEVLAAGHSRFDARFCDRAEPHCAAALIRAGQDPFGLQHCEGVEPYCAQTLFQMGHDAFDVRNCRGVQPACAVEYLRNGGIPIGLGRCR